MLELDQRVGILAQLGQRLKEDNAIPDSVLSKVKQHNPWFIKENVTRALNGIIDEYLDLSKIQAWVSSYKIQNQSPKKIGLILAGNIPLVGIHDIVSVFISGHHAQVKLSDKDNILLPYILKELESISQETKDYFQVVERLKDYDAVIATGSNTSQKYFEKYFGNVPHIIRANRNGVAIIYIDSKAEDIAKLGKDIFSYFGLGCRNVSKVYLEEGVKLEQFYEPIDKYYDIINHHKYKNNYDYTHACLLYTSPSPRDRG